ncbi:MAG: hypothetical protein JWM11_556 [Planctomycetaceae bacterium]|nr:hypothetical protein [Planctomycetaceae bacterium]
MKLRKAVYYAFTALAICILVGERVSAQDATVEKSAAPVSTAAPAKTEDKPDVIKIYHLEHAAAVDSSKLLTDLFPANIKISADARTNSIIVVCNDEERMQAITAILMQLDESTSKLANAKAAPFNRSESPQSTPPQNAQSVNQVDSSGPPPRAMSPPGPSGSMLSAMQMWSGAGSTSPGVRKLSRRLAEYEEKAKRQADEIRNIQKEPGDQHARHHQTRRELEATLATALEVKLELEQLQIKSLEDRLLRLKTQIEKRRASGKKIVQHRATELIEGTDLQWNGQESTVSSRTPDGQSASGSSATSSSESAFESRAVPAIHRDGLLDKYGPRTAGQSPPDAEPVSKKTEKP